MAHYCSAKCQKKHFSFHKHSCKTIADLTKDIGCTTTGSNINGMEKVESLVLCTLGDLLVETGYRETDTIENGSVYYRQALKHYMDVLPVLNNNAEDFFHPSNPLEDKILLLLVLLGGNGDTLREWMQHSGSPREAYYDQKLGREKLPPLPFDVTFHVVCKLLVSMRALANYRQQNPDNDEEEDQHPALKKEVEDLVQRIQTEGKGHYLVCLRDKIPLNPQDTPDLFRGGPGNNNNDDVPSTIREFWLLFQDCFFLTPGLNSVLHEFVPEE